MPKKPEWQQIAETIIETHDGQMYYSFKDVCKIIGCGINKVPCLFNDAGILVKKVGTCKRVSAYDIASVMCDKRTSAVG
jgi:hypothetical protein